MKITIFKNPKKYNTRDYDLTKCSAEELEKTLTEHCGLLGINPAGAAIVIPPKEIYSCEYIVKGTTTEMSMKEVACELLTLMGRGSGEYGTLSPGPSESKSFANGYDFFCRDCNVFFSAQVMDREPAFCPCCGEDDIINSAADLLDHCNSCDVDPVNFYSAFPLHEPIPQSCTGATPRQVEWIVGCVISDRQKKIPVTAESLAAQLCYDEKIVTAVFEELHLTQTGGTK